MEEKTLNAQAAKEAAAGGEQEELDRLFERRFNKLAYERDARRAAEKKAEARQKWELERTRRLRRNLLQMLGWLALGAAVFAAVRGQLIHPYIGSAVISLCLLSEGWLFRSAQALSERCG